MISDQRTGEMTTGRIEYAPDYKSRAEKTADRYRSFLDVTKMEIVDYEPKPKADMAERARLEHRVIEAAKSLRQAALYPAADWPIEREMENFNRDVDLLLDFEVEQKEAK